MLTEAPTSTNKIISDINHIFENLTWKIFAKLGYLLNIVTPIAIIAKNPLIANLPSNDFSILTNKKQILNKIITL